MACRGGGLTPRWVAAFRDSDPDPEAKIVHGWWNLVGSDGNWVWNEGVPADIPVLNGERVLILEEQTYPRSWNAGRIYPLVKADLWVVEELDPAEAAHWWSLTESDNDTPALPSAADLPEEPTSEATTSSWWHKSDDTSTSPPSEAHPVFEAHSDAEDIKPAASSTTLTDSSQMTLLRVPPRQQPRLHPSPPRTRTRPHPAGNRFRKPSTFRSSLTRCSPPTTRRTPPALPQTQTATRTTQNPARTRPAPLCCHPCHPGCLIVQGGGPAGGNPTFTGKGPHTPAERGSGALASGVAPGRSGYTPSSPSSIRSANPSSSSATLAACIPLGR